MKIISMILLGALLVTTACAEEKPLVPQQPYKNIYGWPFPPLSAKEKEERIKLLLDPKYKYEITDNSDELDCQAIFNAFQTGEGLEILTPDVAADNPGDPEIERHLNMCPDLHIDTVYMAAMTEEEKETYTYENKLKFFAGGKPVANLEIYDLAKHGGPVNTYVFGAEAWVNYTKNQGDDPQGWRSTATYKTYRGEPICKDLQRREGSSRWSGGQPVQYLSTHGLARIHDEGPVFFDFIANVTKEKNIKYGLSQVLISFQGLSGAALQRCDIRYHRNKGE